MALKLGLISRKTPPADPAGVVHVHDRMLQVVDMLTGAPVGNLTAMLWAPGEALSAAEPLFEPDHFEPGQEYLCVVVPCSAVAHEVEPTDRGRVNGTIPKTTN